MRTDDRSSKPARGASKTDDQAPADTRGASDTSPDESVGPPGGAGKRRGPYRTGDAPTRDLLRDSQVAAFAEALKRIRDPEQRALVAWLVREFAQQKENSEPAVEGDAPAGKRAGSKS